LEGGDESGKARPVWGKGRLSKERSVKRLISLVGAFHRKMNNVGGKLCLRVKE